VWLENTKFLLGNIKKIKMEISILVQVALKKLRPTIPLMPNHLESLIKHCWDQDKDKRPNSNDVLVVLENLEKEMKENRDEWNGFIKKK